VDALSPTFGFMDPDQIRAATAAIDQLLDYVGTLVSLRRSSPADDLITSLLVAEYMGDRLTHEELVDMVANLLVGGHDTTSSQIGCTFLTLLAHPDSLEALGTRPDLVPAAVMETMRFEPSIGAIPRTVVDPLPVGAEERPPGLVVLLSLSAANRDPDVWRDPGAFRLDRFADPDAPKLLSFGTGPHFCLGAHLARMTLQETVRGLIARPLELTGDPRALEWRTVLGRSPVDLEVAVV
jgi:cytochrome P450